MIYLPPIRELKKGFAEVKFEWSDEDCKGHEISLVSEGGGYFVVLKADELRVDPAELRDLGDWAIKTCAYLDAEANGEWGNPKTTPPLSLK